MQRTEMKQIVRKLAKPITRDLFNELEYSEEELKLMEYLYIDKVRNQYWVADELGISLPTLTKIHNNCIDQMISFYNYQCYKKNHHEDNCLDKYFVVN